MKYAIDVPNLGRYGDPAFFGELAQATEEAGWDGLSLWDHILVESGTEVADPWVLLASAATLTKRVRLITMVTAIPRRRPWVVARQVATLDRLSGGRMVLGVGIGHPPEPEFGAFGEPTDARLRADKLDEALAIITGMWSGEPFGFDGEQYTIEEAAFLPTPVQRPRVPIWVAGMWPRRRPFRRAAKWDGVAPIYSGGEGIRGLEPHELQSLLSYVAEHRSTDAPFDAAIGVGLPSDPAEAGAVAADWEAAGATWLRVMPSQHQDPADFTARVAVGPPR